MPRLLDAPYRTAVPLVSLPPLPCAPIPACAACGASADPPPLVHHGSTRPTPTLSH